MFHEKNEQLKERSLKMAQEEKKVLEALKEKMSPMNFSKLLDGLRELDEYEQVMRDAKDFDIDLTTVEKDVIREALVKMCWLFENEFLHNPKWHRRFQSLQMAFPLPFSGEGSSEIAIFEWKQIVVALRNMLQLDYSEIEQMKFRDLAQKINDALSSEGK